MDESGSSSGHVTYIHEKSRTSWCSVGISSQLCKTFIIMWLLCVEYVISKRVWTDQHDSTLEYIVEISIIHYVSCNVTFVIKSLHHCSKDLSYKCSICRSLWFAFVPYGIWSLAIRHPSSRSSAQGTCPAYVHIFIGYMCTSCCKCLPFLAAATDRWWRACSLKHIKNVIL